MADSKREAILKAVTTRLNTIAGLEVQRSRPIPFERSRTPAAIVSWIADNPSEEIRSFIDWVLTVRIVLVTTGDVPDQLADSFVQSIHSAILQDTSLGGLSMDITTASVQNEIIEGDKNRGFISMDYRIAYRTQTVNLTI